MSYLQSQSALQFQKSCFSFFQQTKNQLLHKPKHSKDRKCTDIFCLFILIIILLAFVVYSIYSIDKMLQLQNIGLDLVNNVTFLNNISKQLFQKTIVTIGFCVGIAMGLALIILVLLKIFPSQTLTAMAMTTVLIPLTLTVIAFTYTPGDIGYYFLCITLICGGFILSQKDSINKAAILIKTIGNFIFQNLQILIVLLFSLFYSLLSLFFWFTGFCAFCILYSQNLLSYQALVWSMVYWVFMLFFFNTFFYYTNLFLNSTAIVIWFYNRPADDDSFDIVTTPFKLLVRYHLGTVTFMTFISLGAKILRVILFVARIFNGLFQEKCVFIGLCFRLLVCCCTGTLQAFILLIGDYTIVLCGVTGFGLIDSSKILGQLIFNDKDLNFLTFGFMNILVSLGGNMIIWLIPTLICGCILLQLTSSLWALSLIIIMFTSSIIGSLFLSVFVQSMTTLFLIYNIDGKLSQLGVAIQWHQHVAQQLNKSFDQAFVGQIKKYKIKIKKIKNFVIFDDGRHQIYQTEEKFKQQITNQDILPPMNVIKSKQVEIVFGEGKNTQ